MERPRRRVTASPYSLDNLGMGVPRPIRRSTTSRSSTMQGMELAFAGAVVSPGVQDSVLRAPKIPHELPGAAAGESCLRDHEKQDRLMLASTLAKFCIHLGGAEGSSVLVAMGTCVSVNDIAPLFCDRAPSTLRRHISGWKRWLQFCSALEWSAASPSLTQVVDFVKSLSEGVRSDRGRLRAKSASGVLAAMKFVAYKLQLSMLHASLTNPLVQAWSRQGMWDSMPVKEAVPLPLWVVRNLELATMQDLGDGEWVVLCCLLMIWGSLRWSDAQRMDLSSICSSRGEVRGWCWRTKSSPRGMPFGVLSKGCTGCNWGARFYDRVCQLRSQFPKRDFLVGSFDKPIGYSCMLAQLRRCLVHFGGVPREHVHMFTLHSLKTTVLAWALQLQVAEPEKAAQGHHRFNGTARCVPRYGRNDIIPAIRCQSKVIGAIAGGWVPSTPLNRGCMTLEEAESFFARAQAAATMPKPSDAPCEACSDTGDEDEDEVEEEGEESISEPQRMCSPGSSSSDTDNAISSEDESVASGSEHECAHPNCAGVWIVNGSSGYFHRAVKIDVEDSRLVLANWRLACRPSLALRDFYSLSQDDPQFAGFSPCQHTGCFGQTQ